MILPIFKALADSTRLRLLCLLLGYELSVNELVEVLEMGQSRISRHLKILTEAGLLSFRRNGLWVFYRANPSGLPGDLLKAIEPFLPQLEHAEADRARAAAVMSERDRRSRAFFNAVAEDWDELNREILGDFDLPAHVEQALPASCSTAVDLGCGTGAVLARLLERVPHVIGVDGALGMLNLCRKRLAGGQCESSQGLSLRIGELSHLPLRDHEADFASVNLVLHHLADPEAGLAEIQRILRPGGTLFLCDFMLHDNESMRVRYGDQWLGFEESWLLERLERCFFETSNLQRVAVGMNLTLFLLTANTRRINDQAP